MSTPVIEVRARRGGGWVVGVRYGSDGVYNWQRGCRTQAEVRAALADANKRRRAILKHRRQLHRRTT